MPAAPLIATADAPLPDGARAFWFDGVGGARLRAAMFPAKGPVRGSVVLSPGRSEPIEKYVEVIGELQDRGLCVLAHDWRGQGLSQRLLDDPLKGHAVGVDDFLSDFRRLLDLVEPDLPRPWLALGHSMGGALTALALAGGERRFSGAWLSAPMMGLAATRRLAGAAPLIARAMIGLGRAGDFVSRGGFDPLLGPFEGNILTHDRARYARYRGQLAAGPQLAIGGVTWGWLAFALDCAARLARPATARAADIPITVVAAGEDRLVLNAPIRRYARHARRCRYVEIAGAFHEVLMETDARRALAWRAFDDLAASVLAAA